MDDPYMVHETLKILASSVKVILCVADLKGVRILSGDVNEAYMHRKDRLTGKYSYCRKRVIWRCSVFQKTRCWNYS